VKFRIVAVGKVREKHLRAAVDDYLDRVRRFHPVEEIEVKDDAALARGLPDRWRVVTLEPGGREMTSGGFADFVGRAMGDGAPGIAFFLGGAEGLPQAITSRAHLRLSMSKLTFPHRLARVMLAEQIYRAMTILRRLPYPR
jgi:23S rRNA (pseudouridine1915-N3)-methyltransferase